MTGIPLIKKFVGRQGGEEKLEAKKRGFRRYLCIGDVRHLRVAVTFAHSEFVNDVVEGETGIHRDRDRRCDRQVNLLLLRLLLLLLKCVG